MVADRPVVSAKVPDTHATDYVPRMRVLAVVGREAISRIMSAKGFAPRSVMLGEVPEVCVETTARYSDPTRGIAPYNNFMAGKVGLYAPASDAAERDPPCGKSI